MPLVAERCQVADVVRDRAFFWRLRLARSRAKRSTRLGEVLTHPAGHALYAFEAPCELIRYLAKCSPQIVLWLIHVGILAPFDDEPSGCGAHDLERSTTLPVEMVNQRTVSPPEFDANSRPLVATAALTEAATRATRALDKHAAQFGLSDAKLQLLEVLRYADGCRACLYTLGEELCVSRPNVTKLVDGLERDGLVARTPHPTDRRMVYAQLTADGERMADEALPGRTEIATQLWSDVSDDEVDRLLFALRSVGH